MSEPARAEAPAERLTALWQRAKKHRIAQWMIGYVAIAYGIQHGVTLTADAFDWPHAVTRISMLLLALGLPLAMTFAWYHGQQASRRVSGPELTIISLLLVAVSILFFVFVRPASEAASAPKTAATQAGVAAARAASLSPSTAISIAVLPFANLSDDRQQEFFSDGMTDEISGALAKIPDLRVVARSSAFQFKGQNKEAREIGQALGATHLIEGSVRQAGNRIRVTAELIRADNGLQLWSDNYDRNLSDVFTIQEDIARAIAASLRMPLGLRPGENLISNRSINAAAYPRYLQARTLFRSRSRPAVAQAVALLEALVALEPNYAPAWGLLGLAYAYTPLLSLASVTGDVDELGRLARTFLPKAEDAANRAVHLDPKYPDGYTALGNVEISRSNHLRAMEMLSQAVALDATNPEALHSYSSSGLADLGYIAQAIPLRRQLLTLEPYVAVFRGVTARILFAAGNLDEAAPFYENTFDQLRFPAAKGQFREADEFLSSPRFGALMQADARSGLAPKFELIRSILQNAGTGKPAQLKEFPPLGAAFQWVYYYSGSPEHMLDYHESSLKAGYQRPGNDIWFWSPAYAALRQTERFKNYVRATHMVDYWRAKGWPDHCHPVGSNDFACD